MNALAAQPCFPFGVVMQLVTLAYLAGAGVVIGPSEDLLQPTDEWISEPEPAVGAVIRALLFGWDRP